MDGKDLSVTGRNVWMTSWEIAALFGVTVAAVNHAMRNLLKCCVLNEHDICRYILLENGYHADVFSLEAVIGLSFKFNTYNAAAFRQWVSERVSGNGEKKGISFFCVVGGISQNKRQPDSLSYISRAAKLMAVTRKPSCKSFRAAAARLAPCTTPSRQG